MATLVSATCALGVGLNALIVVLGSKKSEHLEGDFKYFIACSSFVDGLTACLYFLDQFTFGMAGYFIPYRTIEFLAAAASAPIGSFPLAYSRYLAIVQCTTTRYEDRFGSKGKIAKFCAIFYLSAYILLPLFGAYAYDWRYRVFVPFAQSVIYNPLTMLIFVFCFAPSYFGCENVSRRSEITFKTPARLCRQSNWQYQRWQSDRPKFPY